jgi:hypothetical protein
VITSESETSQQLPTSSNNVISLDEYKFKYKYKYNYKTNVSLKASTRLKEIIK